MSDKGCMADLQGLSKDDLIAIIAELRAENVALKRRLAKLEKDSSNSHKPPSSDIVKPARKTIKGKGHKRKIGGQPGHPKHERTPFTPEQLDAAWDYTHSNNAPAAAANSSTPGVSRVLFNKSS